MPAAGSIDSRSRDDDAWVIAPAAGPGILGRIEEIWRYRRTIWFFAVRSVQALYRKTVLGPIWIPIRVLVPLVVGSLVYGQVMNVDSGPYPYFLFFLVGSTAFSFFDGPVIRGSRGLESNRGLVTRIYLPRIILPPSFMTAGLVEPAICLIVLAGAVGYYRVTEDVWYVAFDARLLVAAAAAAQAWLLAAGVTMFTSIWQARARDFRYLIRYAMAFWLVLTPVIYGIDALPEAVRPYAAFNPMTGPVLAFKWGILGTAAFPAWELAVSGALTAVTLVAGVWYFTRAENAAADSL